MFKVTGSQGYAPTESSPLSGKTVWVAGHRGLLGQAIVRELQRESCRILTVDRDNLDLHHQTDVQNWIFSNKPDVIFVAAGTVGGIVANSSKPWDFLRDNLLIALNVIDAARKAGVLRLIYIASSCMYPRDAACPLSEKDLLTGSFEPTNRWYALSKVAGVMMTQALRLQYGLDYISVIPTNLYGPGDSFDLENSHVLSALVRKTHEALYNNRQTLSVWGSGKPIREFLYVDDCASACVYLANNYHDQRPINIGTGEAISVANLARKISDIVGFDGGLEFDLSKPDGAPNKMLNVTRLHNLGWKHEFSLEEGIRRTYDWYLANIDTLL